MQHDFIINTENVNGYNYRILTDGIDYTQYERNPVVLYLHDRDSYRNKGTEVIGRCLKLFKKDSQLIATIEFDENEPFAKTIADKVAGGFIRMASMYAEVIAASSEPELVLPGQLYETVTKCKLVEISIVPIGGNDDALKLSKNDGNVKLNKLNIKKEDMSELKTIALALGKSADASESVLLDTITQVKLEASEAATAKAKVLELEAEIKGIRLSGATVLVDQAIKLGLIPEALKASQLGAFENDFEGQTAILSKLITDKEAANGGTQTKVKEVVLAGKSTTGITTDDVKESFDYLQKHDTVKLAKIREEDPTKYAELAKAYANGVRYTK
ncbi:HK97 family phage prohead protease [Flavobacterium soyangense]|uniref:HK97 family phage prohead protease n=1 Tax=Flavobacterium soyangense TaxID=2023265 RepID=A0A930UAY4_9FLAO|nr:HK97 family phage prohead protease [Flavobacterium soyangense]MBF2707517.1 HK97 family phage prohead protease [Flavobacterium soyangense]